MGGGGAELRRNRGIWNRGGARLPADEVLDAAPPFGRRPPREQRVDRKDLFLLVKRRRPRFRRRLVIVVVVGRLAAAAAARRRLEAELARDRRLRAELGAARAEVVHVPRARAVAHGALLARASPPEIRVGRFRSVIYGENGRGRWLGRSTMGPNRESRDRRELCVAVKFAPRTPQGCRPRRRAA